MQEEIKCPECQGYGQYPMEDGSYTKCSICLGKGSIKN